MNFCIVVVLQLNASWHMFVVSVYNAVMYSLINFTHAQPTCTIFRYFWYFVLLTGFELFYSILI